MPRRTNRRPRPEPPAAPATPAPSRRGAVLAGAFLVALVAAVTYGVTARGGRVDGRMPAECARMYAALPDPPDSSLIDAFTPSVTRKRGSGPNCGHYRGLARLARDQARGREPARAR